MGRTALDLAEKYNHSEVVKLLQKVTVTELTKEDIEQINIRMSILLYFLEHPGQKIPHEYYEPLRYKENGLWEQPKNINGILWGLMQKAEKLKIQYPPGFEDSTFPTYLEEIFKNGDQKKLRVLGKFYIGFFGSREGYRDQQLRHIAFERQADGNWVVVGESEKDPEAEEYVRRSLDLEEKLRQKVSAKGLSEQDEDALYTDLSDLASLYERQNKLNDAEALYLRVVKISEKRTADPQSYDHAFPYDLGMNYVTLAQFYAKQKDYAKAQVMYQKSLKTLEPEGIRRYWPQVANEYGDFLLRIGREKEGNAIKKKAQEAFDENDTKGSRQ